MYFMLVLNLGVYIFVVLYVERRDYKCVVQIEGLFFLFFDL